MAKKQNPDDVLKALLSVEDKPEKEVYMKRFGVYFRIQALDGDVIDKITERCSYYVGKGNKREKHIDEEKFGALIIAKACIVPAWEDPALLERYDTKDVSDVIKKRLLAGEIVKLASEILELSGFEEEDDEDEVKN